jgi:hypothetical protein
MDTTVYDITKWLKTQPTWLQEAAIRLQSKSELDDKDYLDFIKIIKGEKTLSPDFSAFVIGTVGSNTVSINSISDIEGIDRLQPRKPLEFSENGISVVYGSNGSGKSGYARILKRASGNTSVQIRACESKSVN